MKKLVLFVFTILGITTLHAQLLTPANGGSVKGMAGERIGITDVAITYGRPAVNGREGRIWGGVVHIGFKNLGFGNGKDVPWRAGANENTTIEFNTEVMIEGHALAAGKYGLFVAYDPGMSTIIFSKNTTSWGSFFYEESEDALRVTVKPVALKESRERLTYEFGSETDSSAVVSLVWEKLSIPFTITTQLQKLQLASFDRALRGEQGFDPGNLVEIANYYQENNVRLPEALVLVNRAARNMPTFNVMVVKAVIQEKLGMQKQADSTMKAAYGVATVLQLHNYGRQLLREKKPQKAFEVFEFNYKHNPDVFTTMVGMARGYSAIGKTSEALKYANKALPLAPDDMNKKTLETIIGTLKAGKELSVM